MKNLLWLGAAGAVLAALVVFFLMRDAPGRKTTPTPDAQTPVGGVKPAASDVVRISIASSITKREWLDDAVQKFNAGSRTDGALQVDGRPIVVEVLKEESEPGRLSHYRSVTQVTDTLSGKIKPTILSPASGAWLAKLSNDWKPKNGGRDIMSEPPKDLLRTPLVIAMWQSKAQALGCWPKATPTCTWSRLRELAESPQGWGLVGHPEWRQFKFGYGLVGESDAGTATALMFCMSGAGKIGNPAGIAFEDVEAKNGCGRAMAAVEHAKVHSGVSTPWLLGWMKTGGPEYLDAITTYEKEVVFFNRDNAKDLREPLVAVYPYDGTQVLHHPIAVLDQASWVSQDQARAARVFQQFLLSGPQYDALPEFGFRPLSPTQPISGPISLSNGVDPDARIVTVAVPDPLLYDRVIEVWHQVKKPAMIALVFDKSGSMGGEKITRAVQGAAAFVGSMSPEDRLLWLPFDEKLYPGTLGRNGDIGERLASDIRGTSAGGGTALYDAIDYALKALTSQRQQYKDTVRYGIVVLSDGKDTNSATTLSQLRALLAPTERDPTGIQIHTIGIGADADENVLKTIAASAHGRYWDAKDPATVVQLYKLIAVYY